MLDAVLPTALNRHGEAWVITGTGHHTAQASHQRKAEGGALRQSVEGYLRECGYDAYPGKDRSGHSGAFLVVARGAR